jgi:ribosomal protein L11 methyltransferase
VSESSKERRYPYVAVDVDESEADDAAALMFDLGAGGVELRDATTLARGAEGKVTLNASFELEDEARAAAGALPAAWSPRIDEVIGDAWRDEWKKHFEPFRIANGIVVCPPWRQHEATSGEFVIVLEPGRAFGTGLHETTSLVAQILVDRVSSFRGRPVLDVGCGSGILSLVALALGAGRARAIDVDPEAVSVTRENAARNRIVDRLEVDDVRVEAIEDRYAAVIANIEAKTLVDIATALTKCVGPGGLLVLSGILAPDVAALQLDDVRAAFARLHEVEVRRNGDWVALVLRA